MHTDLCILLGSIVSQQCLQLQSNTPGFHPACPSTCPLPLMVRRLVPVVLNRSAPSLSPCMYDKPPSHAGCCLSLCPFTQAEPARVCSALHSECTSHVPQPCRRRIPFKSLLDQGSRLTNLFLLRLCHSA